LIEGCRHERSGERTWSRDANGGKHGKRRVEEGFTETLIQWKLTMLLPQKKHLGRHPEFKHYKNLKITCDTF